MLRTWAAAIVALVGAWAAAPCAAEPISAEALLKPRALLDIDLSPDGRSIAAIMRAPDGESYGLATFSADRDGPPTLIPLNGVNPAWVTWVTNDRLLVAVVTSFEITGNTIRWPSARVLAINPDGSSPVLLFDNQRRVLRSSMNLARITALLPDDPDHVLMPGVRGGDLDLWRVNIRNGDAERVAEGRSGTFLWFADREGRPYIRLDVNRAGTVVRAFAPSEDGDDDWREIARVREEDRLEFQPLAAAEEPGTFYTAARPEGEDRAGIYVYDPVTNAFRSKVASDPRVDVEAVMIDPDTGALAGYIYIDDRVELRFLDRRTQAHFDGVREFLGREVSARIYDRSEDGRRWIVEAQGPQEPGAFYLYDLDETQMELLFAAAADISESSLAPMRAIRYRARDDLEITAYLSLPPDRAHEGLPLVVMPHGGPEARDMLAFDIFAQYLASRGYAVLQPNFRGSSGYGRAFADAGRREWGGAMQNDLVDGVRQLAGEGVIDPARVCIFGASYGGYAALAAAALEPDVFRCAISLNGPSDLRGFLRHVRRGDIFDDDDYAYWTEHIGDPGADKVGIDARSPIKRVAEIRAPILLIHGTLDPLIPVEQSREMAESLEEAGVPHRLVEVEGAGHSDWTAEQETQAMEAIAAFLAEHLPAD